MASIEPYLVTSLALTALLGSLCRRLEVSSGKMTLSSKILMACGKWIRSSPLSSRRNSRDVSPKPAPIFFGKSLSDEKFSNRGLFCPIGPQLQLAMIDKMIKLWWEARNMFRWWITFLFKLYLKHRPFQTDRCDSDFFKFIQVSVTPVKAWKTQKGKNEQTKFMSDVGV